MTDRTNALGASGPRHVELEPAVATERTADGMLLFDPRAGTFLHLDDVGAVFWEALDTTDSMDAAVDRICTVFDVDRVEVTADLAGFVAGLADAGLLVTPDTKSAEVTGPDRVDREVDAERDRADRAIARYLDLVEATVTARTSSTVRLGRHVDGIDDLAHLGEVESTPMLTLVGARRISNVRDLAERVLADEIPGDFMECGVWRGGSAIVLAAVLAAHEVTDRRVWLADSFRGLPVPDVDRFPLDAGWADHVGATAVSSAEVAGNFRRFGLLDDRVRFVEGWFRDTLPNAEVERLAILRLDGDLYESTIVALTNLYDRVSPGGFVIIDDYAIESCRAAVDDFRADRGVDVELQQVDWSGVWWRVPPC
ncbi:MAG: hypothetical protein RLZZ01_1936 [Actinomycetota bacterium]